MSRFETVLLALDLTPASDPVLRRARWLAAQPGLQRMQLVHVIDSRILDGIAGLGLGVRAELEQAAREAAAQALAEMAERLRAAGAPEATVECRVGRPEQELAAAVERHAPDLVIAGAGNRLWREVVLGSTARRLLRLLHRPLWLVREDAEGDYRKVLMATAFSPADALAARAAASYWPQAEFELLHVRENLADLIAGLPRRADFDPKALRERIEQRDYEQLAAFAREHLLDRKVITRLEHGHPVGSVLARAREWKPGLVALGRSGRTGLEARVLGSVAEALVELLDCDLLVLPADAG